MIKLDICDFCEVEVLAYEENLKGKGFESRSTDEVREIARKGGISSGKTRRKRKSLAESMNALLELPVSDVKDYNEVAEMGISPENIDNSQLIVLALFRAAKSGDVQAIKELKRMIGEDDTPNTDTLERLDEVLDRIGGNI